MRQKKPKNEHGKSKIDNQDSYDVIIIGGGAAGLSAALWCDELGLSTLILEAAAEAGGQLLRVHNPIENHLGARAANGRQLRDRFLKQIENRGFRVRYESEVSGVDLKAKKVFLTGGESFSSRALILATGVRRRKLSVEGEERFKNRGLLESGKRDAAAVAGKSVLIVGGGDAAMENALILAEQAAQVFLVHRRSIFAAREEFTEKARMNKKVKFLTETMLTKMFGDERIEAVELQNLSTGETFVLPVDAVLLRIGVVPNTEIFRGKVPLDKNGYIEIDANCQTRLSRVFAVGDVANPLAPTISSAVGMGATAAKVVFDKLSGEI